VSAPASTEVVAVPAADRYAERVYAAALALILLVPVFRAGNRPLPLLLLELLALVLLILVAWDRERLAVLPRGHALWLGAFLALPLLFLLPLPFGLWASLPGRGLYAEIQQLAADAVAWRGGSVVPSVTVLSTLAGLLPVAVFVAVRVLDNRRVMRLTGALLAVAALEAALGLAQYGQGPRSALFLGNPFAGHSAAGTYASRNHLAGLLVMVLPIALGLTAATLRRRTRRRERWRDRVAFFSSLRGHQAALFGLLALLLLLALIFTRSRAGIALGMLGLILSVIAFSRRLGGSNVYGTVGTVTAAAGGLAVAIGLLPVWQRFASLDAVENLRWRIFSATLEGIGAFFPLGSGPGTYPAVFPRFEPLGLAPGHYINHAHNDYLEWFFEAGLLAAVLMLWAGVIYVRQWPVLMRGAVWPRSRFVQIGAGLGVGLLALHGLVDYNLRIPANMVYFAFLFAVFLRPPEQPEAKPRRRHHRRATRHPAPEAAPGMSEPHDPGADTGSGSGEREGAADRPRRRVRNPFLDDDPSDD